MNTFKKNALIKRPLSCILVLFGLFIASIGIYNGSPNAVHSIYYGWVTSQWPDTKLEHFSYGATRQAGWTISPEIKSSYASYFYKVGGDWYRCARYDVNGNTISWDARIEDRIRLGKKVYYNPDDPSEAILIPGFSLSLKARFFLKVGLLGLLFSLPGIYRIRKKYKQLVYDDDYDTTVSMSIPPVKQSKSYPKFTRIAIACIAIGIGAYLYSTIANHYHIKNKWAIIQQGESGEKLKEALEYLNAHKQSLANLTLQGANLEGVQLEGAILNYADFKQTSFLNANLKNAMMHKADLQFTNLQGANLSGAKLYYAKISGANLQGINFEKAILEKAILTFSNLSGANLSGANVFGAEMVKADLSSANLSEAKLSYANLRLANLQNAILRGARLGSAVLIDANFQGANLQETELYRSDFQRANLQETNLEDANLAGANLLKANLQGANLKGAKLSRARFHPSDSLTMLTKEQRALIIITTNGNKPYSKNHLALSSSIYDIATTHDEDGNSLPEENWKLIPKDKK